MKEEKSEDDESTPRIDIIKEIAINDDIKKKTQSFSESISKMGSKAILTLKAKES